MDTGDLRTLDILVVEDNPQEARLLEEAFKTADAGDHRSWCRHVGGATICVDYPGNRDFRRHNADVPITTANRIANVSSNPTFLGVTADAPITSIQFQIAAGEVGLILDNFGVGDAAVTPPTPGTVPEPSTIAMLGAALLGIGLLRSKRA